MPQWTLSRVRAVFRLVGDIRDCRAVGADWRGLMTSGLSELVGADAAFSCKSGQPLGYPPQPKPSSIVVGWTAAQSEEWRHILSSGTELVELAGVAASPPSTGTEDSLPGPLTCVRRQLVSDDAWYSGAYVNEVLSRFDVDDNLVSVYRVSPTAHFEAVALFREKHRRPFGDAEVDMVRLFHEEMGRLWDGCSSWGEEALSPRLRETLGGLRDGLSEKELALRLRLSPHTVHDYVKTLYARFGVRSRGALLAKLVPQRASSRS